MVPAVPRLAQQSSAEVRGLGAGLARSQDQAATQARQWLDGVLEDGRKQAAISQSSLKVQVN